MTSPSSSKGYIQTTLSFSPSARNATFSENKSGNEVESSSKRGEVLAKVAQETKAVLPSLLAQLSPDVTANGKLYVRKDLDYLNRKYCPNYILPANDPECGREGTRIRVVNGDSFDVAITL